MSLSLILAALWVLAATVVALLPFRAQFPPGIALLVVAPLLIGFIAWQHGAVWGIVALAGFASMFRNPLIYFARRALRRDTPPPRPDAGQEE